MQSELSCQTCGFDVCQCGDRSREPLLFKDAKPLLPELSKQEVAEKFNILEEEIRNIKDHLSFLILSIKQLVDKTKKGK